MKLLLASPLLFAVACGGAAGPPPAVPGTPTPPPAAPVAAATCFADEPGLDGADLDGRAMAALDANQPAVGACTVDPQTGELRLGDVVVAIVDGCGLELRTSALTFVGALARVGETVGTALVARLNQADRLECTPREHGRAACGLRSADEGYMFDPLVYYVVEGTTEVVEGEAAEAFAAGRVIVALRASTRCD